jgi:hypothetical protein
LLIVRATEAQRTVSSVCTRHGSRDETVFPFNPSEVIMQLDTVNVLEVDASGLPLSLVSFSESSEGNREAETRFATLVSETTDLGSDAIAQAIEDGYADVPGGGMVLLTHSTEGGDNALAYAAKAALADLTRLADYDDEQAKVTFIQLYDQLVQFGVDVSDYRAYYDGYSAN